MFKKYASQFIYLVLLIVCSMLYGYSLSVFCNLGGRDICFSCSASDMESGLATLKALASSLSRGI